MVERDKRYFWLSGQKMRRLQPVFPKARGRVRSDDCEVLSGIASRCPIAVEDRRQRMPALREVASGQAVACYLA